MKVTARGLALGAAGAVAGIVVLASWASGDDSRQPSTARPIQSPTASTAAATATPAAVPASIEPAPTAARDDGAVPNTSPPSTEDAAQVRTAAAGFAATWLNKTTKSPARWREDLLPLVTGEQAELLADAEPDKVPVGVVGDKIEAKPLGDGELWNADVPVLVERYGKARGTLHLTLTKDGDTWLVSDIDYTDLTR
jgi:hypothetical protein